MKEPKFRLYLLHDKVWRKDIYYHVSISVCLKEGHRKHDLDSACGDPGAVNVIFAIR
jgi:hypothetical protein